MLRYLLQRLALGVAALLAVATITFFMMHAVPGDPLARDRAINETIRANLAERYGLDKPLMTQYRLYMQKMLLEGDFGVSFKQDNVTVNDIIMTHGWVSAVLVLVALGLAVIGGVVLGAVAGLNHNRWPDYLAMMVAVLGISTPSFVVAYLLQNLMAVQLHLLPVGGWDGPLSIVLPAVSLGLAVMASLARITRSSMLDVVRQDYVKTAKAKGLSRWQIMIRHQLRNAILPVVVYTGPYFAVLMTATFVVESIFGVPGLGHFFVTSVSDLDYTVIMGLTVFYAGFAIIMALVFDLIYSLVDPRIRLAK